MKNVKLVAVLGGGDWVDASVHHLAMSADFNLDELKKEWVDWYQDVYLKNRPNVKYVSFVDFLKSKGARDAESAEIEIYDDSGF